MPATRTILLVTAALAAFGAGALVSRQVHRDDPAALAIEANVLSSPRLLPQFTLTDHHGKRFDRERLAKGWTFLFFGFTHCPDVCPAALFTLARVAESLETLEPSRRPAVTFLSVDPMRDTPAALAAYVPHFDASFLGVTGELAELQKLTDAMGVAYRYVREPDSDNYTVDHTAAIFLVGPDSALRAIFGAPHTAEAIARDYRRILEQEAG